MKKNKSIKICPKEKVRFFLTALMLCSFSIKSYAQDTTILMNQLENEATQFKTVYAIATFKSTRIVDGQSIENLPAKVLDVRISHRFGPISSGAYNFFGLDHATMRLGFDYGITNNLMAGVGHSTYQKTYDAFVKLKLLRQSAGLINSPVSISLVPTIAVNTLRQFDSSKTKFRDRVSMVYQALIARKFSDQMAMQIMPTFIQTDLISFNHTRRIILGLGIGGRYKFSKRINLNAEYYYQLPKTQSADSRNVFALGVDIGTGGHVFQLHFTNSFGLTEKSFISETTGRWDNSDILFGFNISRIFQF